MANFTIFFIVMASIEDHGLIIDIVACLLYSHFVYSLSWCMYCYIFTSQPLIDDYLEEIKQIKRSFLEHMERRNKKLHHV
uniref:Uncharacterized protein n=1 Tax=Caenorhabditis tropicalis TaxID=1561998 RepID=A0A1I7U7R9_9PELO